MRRDTVGWYLLDASVIYKWPKAPEIDLVTLSDEQRAEIMARRAKASARRSAKSRARGYEAAQNTAAAA